MRRPLLMNWWGFRVEVGNQPLSWPGVYLLTCTKNGRRYVGACGNLVERLRKYKASGKALAADLRQYGKENFRLEPLYYNLMDVPIYLEEVEAHLILQWQTMQPAGYNAYQRAASVNALKQAWLRRRDERVAEMQSVEHRQVLSNAQLARYAQPGQREAVSVRSKRQWARSGVREKASASAKAYALTVEGRSAKSTVKGMRWITNGIEARAVWPDAVLPLGWRWGKTDKRIKEGLPKVLKPKLIVKGSLWITDGVNSKRVMQSTPLPEHWRLGKAPIRSKHL